MKDSYSEKLVVLYAQERDTLQQKAFGYSVFLAIIFVFMTVGYFILPDDKIVKSVFAVFSLFISGIMLWLIRGFYLDLKSNKKLVIRGLVEEREINYFKSGKRAQSFVYIENKKFVVDINDYVSVGAGDFVELHYAPNSSTCLLLSLLHKNQHRAEKPPINQQNITRVEAQAPTTQRFTGQDKKILTKALFKNLLFNFLALLFSSWLILGLLIGDLWFILLFLFPIPLLFLFSIYKIISKSVRCIIEIKSGHKLITKSVINDKHRIQKRARNYYFIKTPVKEYLVDAALYQKAKMNEVTYFSVSSKSNILIGIKQSDGEFLVNTAASTLVNTKT